MLKQTALYAVLFSMILAGCSAPDDLASKQESLKQLEKERIDLDKKIADLKIEIGLLDSNAVAEKPKGILVTTQPIRKKKFEHFVEVQGAAASRENIQLSAEMGGMVQKVLVKEGDKVSKGQLIVQLDASLIRNNIAELKTALDLATTTYQKQKKLWDQKIGSEMQYLQAKNQKESLEKKLVTANTQLSKMQVKSPISGSIDEVFIRIGEMAAPGLPIARIVNLNRIYMRSDISEAYVGSFQKGDSVWVEFPSLNIEESTRITAVGQFINPNNRTFKVEVSLDNTANQYKPNMLGLIKLRDMVKDNALVVPTKYIENVKGHHFVYVVNKENGQDLARQVKIELGPAYNGESLIVSGLTENQQLITEGFRGVKNGDLIDIKQL